MTPIIFYMLFITTCITVGLGFTILIHYSSGNIEKFFGLVIFVFSILGLLHLSSEALLCNDIETLEQRIEEIKKNE